MARVVVDVMLKPEILDPQGQAIARKLPQMGFEGIGWVRQGKRFEIELGGPADAAALERIHKVAETLLANPVIENFEVRVLDGPSEQEPEEEPEEEPEDADNGQEALFPEDAVPDEAGPDEAGQEKTGQ